MAQPEVYYCKPTKHAPNSNLPVLVYRDVLPKENLNEDTATAVLESNNWIKGGKWKHIPTPHYHSNTHECYAAISGQTRCRYGVGPLDSEGDGIEFDMKAGDIAVHAAGVIHRNLISSDDYEYIGVYPKGAPHWNNNYAKDDPETTQKKSDEARAVPIPDHDPISGRDGPLPKLWRAAASS